MLNDVPSDLTSLGIKKVNGKEGYIAYERVI